MIPQKGQFVQVRFNNGIFFDAIVEEWSDQKSELILPDTKERVIIQKTLQDVLLVKIINNIPKNEQPNELQQSNVYLGNKSVYVDNLEPIHIKNELYNEFETLKKEPKNPNSLARMAELKDELNKIEREEILKKSRSFEPTGTRTVSYGIPRNIQISSSAQHSIKKTTPTDSEFNTELQNLFK